MSVTETATDPRFGVREGPSSNAAQWLVGRQVEGLAAQAIAVQSGDRSLSYEQLWSEVQTVAAGLHHVGVRPEQRVMMCMADDVELFVAILATWWMGAVAVPVSTMLTATELAPLVHDCRPAVVLASTEFESTVRQAVPAGRPVEIVVDDAWSSLTGHGRMRECGPTGAEDAALWLYTSGTTGLPKAAVHRHADVEVVSRCFGDGVLNLVPSDRCLSAAKLFFAYGLVSSLVLPLAVGATAVLERRPCTADVLVERIAADRPTVLFAVPVLWDRLSASIEAPDLDGLRQGVSAGEALPARVFENCRDRLGVEVLDGLGSTEMLYIYLSSRPGQAVAGRLGEAVPGYDLDVRDGEGRSIVGFPGEVGELWVRGESAATGYWARTAATRDTFVGAWVKTGDQVRVTDDGGLELLGRTHDVMKVGGIWVSPAEVEQRLGAHPSVAQVAVVAQLDADGLEYPVAFVVPATPETPDEDVLLAWCRAELASFKRPRSIIFVQALPRTATGKLQRVTLRSALRASV